MTPAPTAPIVCLAREHESLSWNDDTFDFKYIDGRRWRMLGDLPFHYAFEDAHVDGCVPKGLIINFHSVPRFLWTLIHPFEYGQAAALHDYLYGSHLVDRRLADEIYLAALTKCGAGVARRRAMYRAVRMFGWNAYRKGGQKGQATNG